MLGVVNGNGVSKMMKQAQKAHKPRRTKKQESGITENKKKKKKNKVREIELWYEAAMKLQCGGVRLGKEGSM